MKKILIVTLSLLLSTVIFAQNNVTQFLGIPVDGSKSAMIEKLKAKGFSIDSSEYWEQYNTIREENNVSALPMN